MADGDVVLDRDVEVDADEGSCVQLFAVEDSPYPGGYYYRFQYYAPGEREEIPDTITPTTPTSVPTIDTMARE